MTKHHTNSPFHAGEQALQSRVGRREVTEELGRRVIRDHMPDQHRKFYALLPFIVVGAVDASGAPWATVLSGQPGFIDTPNEHTLEIHAGPQKNDPVADALKVGSPLGLLGIELSTRRRNRLNGRVLSDESGRFSVRVDQAFGNCPRYIQSRDMVSVTQARTNDSVPERFTGLSSQAAALVARADTFFVSSYVPLSDRPEVEGVDVSHRGGQPGFVKVDGSVLTVPDFSGNKHFNTLGNFVLNPKAGLVFPDFATGDLLQLTGSVELLDEDHSEVVAFQGAERAWRLTVSHGNWLRATLPFEFADAEPSRHNRSTDNWHAATQRACA